METIQKQYKRLRADCKFKGGCLVLFAGTGIISKVIGEADNAVYKHIGGADFLRNALVIIDANADGVNFDRFSKRVYSYKDNSHLLIIEPLASVERIDKAMCKVLAIYDEYNIGYDFINGLKELINRYAKHIAKEYFGKEIKSVLKLSLSTQKICSMVWKQYAMELGMFNDDFYLHGLHLDNTIIFPQDFMRFRNELTTKVYV